MIQYFKRQSSIESKEKQGKAGVEQRKGAELMLDEEINQRPLK